MKKQYLTSTQKEVLLEMCRAMFPEIPSEKIEWYNDQNMDEDMFPEAIDNSEECEEFIIFNSHNTKIPVERNEDEPAITVHWTELCICELGERIIGHDADKFSEMVYDHMLGTRHMIDYLYEQFKKNKL